MPKNLVMQMYAVLLTLFSACVIYDNMIALVLFPTVVILGEVKKAYGALGLTLGIFGIIGALLLTYGIRHF